VLGVFIITPLSDMYGRRMAIFAGSIIAVIGSGLCTGAINGKTPKPVLRMKSLKL
jgi:MFS family permease